MSGKTFNGFSSRKTRLTRLPADFFTELLPQVDHLGELKTILYAMWFLERQEGRSRYIRYLDFSNDAVFMQGLAAAPQQASIELDDALQRAVQRGVFLKAEVEQGGKSETIYLINSARGKAALLALESGDWQPGDDPSAAVTLVNERPNIFRLYEENFGPLTPMMADVLKEADQMFALNDIEDAIRVAVKNNVRKWRYVEAILTSWKEKGRDGEHSRSAEEDRDRYNKGAYADLIEH